MTTPTPDRSLTILMTGYLNEGTGGYPDLIAEELESLGHRVVFLRHPGLNTRRSYSSLLGRFHRVGVRDWFRLCRRLLSAIRRHRVDVVLIMGSNYWLGPSTLRLVRRWGAQVVLWEGNLEFGTGFQIDALRFVDLVIVNDSYIVPFLRTVIGHPHVLHIEGTVGVPEAFSPPPASALADSPYTTDVAFVGHYFPSRARLLGALRTPVRVWGARWNLSDLPEGHTIKPVPLEDKPMVFASSKINLHLRPDRQMIHGFSTRIAEVPLCGGFVLAERTPDLVRCFEDGREIATFATAEEAQQQIDYYLDRAEEREQMTRRLVAKICSEHHLSSVVARINSSLLAL
jgi:hypothetical protein